MIPGSNILQMALGLVGAQTVGLRVFQGETQNAAGFNVPTWADPVDIAGSFQPVSADMMQTLGLDMTKNYAVFYASANFNEVRRGATGDLLEYGGKTYQIESTTKWFTQDGWDGALCVEVTNA
jgi:hypothetical protein